MCGLFVADLFSYGRVQVGNGGGASHVEGTASQSRRDPPWVIGLLAKDQRESQVGDAMLERFPDREFAVATDCLCDPFDAPVGSEVFAWGGRSRAVTVQLLLVLPMFYLSDRPQQNYVTGHLDGNPLVSRRLTVDHRSEYVDTTSMDYVPCDHHRRMVTTDHARAILQMVHQWPANWKTLGCKVLQMVGLTNQVQLPYRDWNMRQITYFEFFHIHVLGEVAKFSNYMLAWLQQYDPDLVRRALILWIRKNDCVHREGHR